ncbi:hypothetical protein [Pseudomonas sp.]|uniref:hypothetical protein n=1 Tax=Pseudomonas sp. TaxID=306 RepID=UPI00299D5D59|nr:hypothetical protein [Pseudomonas sp.]MDX1367615.1 hypothetical protein [Pseudomonas sp.]
MNRQKIDEFIERYESMDEWQIIEIHSKEKDLTNEARIALATVISKRGVDLNKVLEEAKEEDLARTEKAKIRIDNQRKRDTRIYKIFFVIAVPIILLGAVFRPERAFETFISSLAQAAGIAIIFWLALMLKRFLRRLKK